MKKLILLFVFFCVFSNLFSNETIVLYSFQDYVTKHETETVQCIVTLDSEGKIIEHKYSNCDYTCKYSCDGNKLIENVIYSDSNKKPFVSEHGFGFQIDEEKQTYCIESHGIQWFFEKGCLFWVEEHDLIQVIFYIKNDERCEEICFSNNSNFRNPIFSKPESVLNKIKSKDKNINLYNAKILTLIGPQSIIPYLLFDDDFIPTAKSYSATSELKEKNVVYKAENLRTIEGLPWASANGKGINDKIIIEVPRNNVIKLSFYNGFQDQQKKYLYKYNSRIKKIKITNLYNNKSTVEELKDVPEKQTVTFNYSETDYWSGAFARFEIEILEVYPGEKYDDLCIQAIIPEY